MIKKNVLIPIIIYLFSAIAFGDGIESTIDDYLRKVQTETAIPGFSVAVVVNDRIILSNGYGVEVSGTDIPMTGKTLSAIGSIGKSFTSIALMQAVENGLIDLDLPVIEYLPWFQTAEKSSSDRITLRMLLSNSSGLPMLNKNSNYLEPDVQKEMRMVAESLNSAFMRYEPGAGFEYSNAGFVVAALVLSELSGQSFTDYMKENILKPLSMNKTVINPANYDSSAVLQGHSLGISRANPLSKIPLQNTGLLPAGSFFYSSADEMGNYMISLLNEGIYKSRQLISPESLRTMWTSQISLPGLSEEMGGNGNDIDYCLGWMKTEIDGRTVIFHQGEIKSMTSIILLDPEKKLGVVLLSNSGLLNPYADPSLTNIGNNILRLLSGKPVNNFGRPIIEDPTRNNFQLESSSQSHYVGTYFPSAIGGSQLMNQISIIEDTDNRLIMRSIIGQEIIAESVLDFVSPGIAVNRNIGEPLPVKFQILPDSTVVSLEHSGVPFIKRSEYKAGYVRSEIEDSQFSFLLPENWSIIPGKDMIKISPPDDEETHLLIRQSDDPVFDPAKDYEYNTASLSVIAEYRENIAGIICDETIYEINNQSAKKQGLHVRCLIGNGYLDLFLVTGTGRLTDRIKTAVLPLLQSLKFVESSKKIY